MTTELGRLLYSSGEAAKMCGVSRNTWCRWVREGAAPMPVDVAGARKWLASDFKKWEKEMKVTASKRRLKF